MTKSKGVGRGRKGIPRGAISIKGGKKLCRGPKHPNGVWLPANLEYFNKETNKGAAGLSSWCRECKAAYFAKDYRGRNIGFVPVAQVRWVLIELEARIGRSEISRKMGTSPSKVTNWFNGQKYFQRRTVAKLLLVLRQVRDDNELRTKRDIKWGRKTRGYPETARPKSPNEFNRQNDDLQAAYRRLRRKDIE
jgi:hypothetical protein